MYYLFLEYNLSMKKFLLVLTLFLYFIQPANACFWFDRSDEAAVRKLINSQVKYANRYNLKKLVSTYDTSYVNGDGFNLEVYSKLIKDIWDTYNNVEYAIDIKDIRVNDDTAIAEVVEKSNASVVASHVIEGHLNSVSNSVYYLKKIENKWKVVSDKVVDETTSLLYGDAADLDIKLTVPTEIEADTEYSAILEFTPPENCIAIASLASDKVEYPQKQTQEVFRAMPEDNVLERLFTSNNDKANEYIVASIGLTRTAVDDLSVKLSLTGFGYMIKRVNVIGANRGGFEYVDVKN